MRYLLNPPPIDIQWHRLARQGEYKASKVADLAGVSLRTLQRHFRTRYGLTVSDWLSSTRIQEASARINAGDRVKKVALDLGYKQLSHFSREFKRAYGLPPSTVASERVGNAHI